MVFNHPQYGFTPSRAEFTIGNSHSEVYTTEDDGENLPSPVMFGADIMSSPDAQRRRPSLPNSNGVLSPVESLGWDQQGNGEPEPTSASSATNFRQTILRPGAPHVQTFVGQAHPTWAYEPHSGHVTPSPASGYPPVPNFPGGHPPPHFAQHRVDVQQPLFHQPASHHMMRQQSFPGPPPPPEAHFIPVAQSRAKSPHSHQDYMLMAQAEVEGRAASKRIRPGSPVRTSVDAQRRDGVRKKNGRIDIPQERNITHIDELLQQVEDEDVIKELKQQKRLLRNREAALASRQRKKKHTEELESREKDCHQTIQAYSLQVQELEERDLHWQRREQELQRELQVAHDSYRNMKRAHDEETSVLRKRIQLLTEQVEAGPAPAMSALPSSSGFTECNAGMEALNMDQDNWDNFFEFGDFTEVPEDGSFTIKPEPAPPRPTLERKSFSTNDATTRAEDTSDSSFGSSILFFLLLCGAFVATKPASSQASDIPALPDNVRAAAPAVLNNLLGDTTVQTAPATIRRDSTLEPRQSSMPMRARANRMERMHHHLTAPTKQQEIDHAFSLTTTQYASISDPDFHPHDDNDLHRGSHRPSLAETLAQSRHEYMATTNAEVYTRSLLMDRIPADVVAQFKEMVRDHNEIDARRQQQAGHDADPFTYKIET